MMYYGFAPFGWIFMLVFWCLIIGVVVALARGGFGKVICVAMIITMTHV